MKIRPCKICGGTHFKKLGELCSNMKVMGNHFPDGKCDIVTCLDCGFVFYHCENTEQKDFDEYYRSVSKTMNYYDMYPKKVADDYFLHIFEMIQGYITKDSKILDVAGGYGELAHLLMEKGYPNVTVLDMKSECIQEINKMGISSIEGNLLELETQESYDLVICSHILEHFMDIDTALQKVKELTKPGGYVYLEVPDMAQYSKLDRAPYHFLTYEHICHFTEVTFHNIASQFGFQMMYLKKYIKCHDYPCLCTMLKPTNQSIEMIQDRESASLILEYIQNCEEKISVVTAQFENSKRPLILWGIGASTAQLLNGNFDRCNVIQLVDSNPARQGLSFKVGKHVLQVEAPSNVQRRDAVIFILSTAYKTSIERSIRGLGYQNDIASL